MALIYPFVNVLQMLPIVNLTHSKLGQRRSTKRLLVKTRIRAWSIGYRDQNVGRLIASQAICELKTSCKFYNSFFVCSLVLL